MGRLFLLQEQCLRLMGHSMDSQSNDDRALTLGLKHFASLLLVISAEYPMMSYVMYNRDDIELVTASLSVVFTNLLTVIKISTFLVYKQNFWQLMHSFRQIYPKFHQSASDVVGHDYITKDNNFAALLGKAYCISCACTGLYFMLDPILKIISSHWRGEIYIRELPMPMKFPFNDVNTPGYEFGFGYTVFVTIAVVLYASAVDGLFISFAFNLRAHFQALQQRIQQLTFDQSAEADHEQMIHVVQYHVKLLDLSKQLRITYMPIVFGQFLITSIQVGVIIYQILTHMDNAMALIRFFSFFGSIMLQLFLYCYGGELIKNESLQVGVAVQLADWHLATPKQRRSLAFIMHCSQRGMLIKAGFYEASLANFLAIFRAAMSFIAVIQSAE
ncbi:odorant receptor 82a [Drosophila albomicans]|uniref:Odorant receptor n=1 Tax=Drosophila albomicans TaxID=7291 RepID=A0A9C6WI01_DROAB|nr:odorant receptor 82a [Drosophila albomicans]